jgi:hypothetical protein
LGKVDDVAGVVNQGKAERGEGISRPHRDAGKEKLQELGKHYDLPACGHIAFIVRLLNDYFCAMAV